jgi:hypothetical protein
MLDFYTHPCSKKYMDLGHDLCAQDTQKAKPMPKSTDQASPVVFEKTGLDVNIVYP